MLRNLMARQLTGSFLGWSSKIQIIVQVEQ